jgi:TRAP transporter TAXI family solute receptor
MPERPFGEVAMASKALRVLALLAAFLVSSMASSAREPHWPDSLVLGTASPGGTYYDYGDGLARILTRALGIPVLARPTEGPSQNILLLERGEIQLAFVTQGVALQAWNGTGTWTGGRQLRAMRAMFPMYDTPFQFVTLQDSGIQSIADLAGKRVGDGPQGGTAGTYVPELLKVLKVEASLVHGDWADLAAQVVDRRIDALAVAAGVPFPALGDIERRAKVRYLPLSQKQILDLRLAKPELGASVVAAGSYPSLRRHYPTVGLYNFAVAHRDLPDDLVYAIVEAVFANHEQLIEAHPAAAETIPANFSRNAFMPFHGGAGRWYHTRGVMGVSGGD